MIGVLIASFILLLSSISLALIAKQKLPLLLAYPKFQEGNSAREVARKAVEKIRESRAFQKVSSPDVLLQSALSKTRIAALRTESTTGKLLENLRKKSKDNAPTFSKDYWKKLKGKE